MFLETILTSSIATKIEDYASLIKEDVKFVNTTANQWQITISFDLDSTTMNPVEKEALTAMLKYM